MAARAFHLGAASGSRWEVDSVRRAGSKSSWFIHGMLRSDINPIDKFLYRQDIGNKDDIVQDSKLSGGMNFSSIRPEVFGCS